MAAFKYKTDEEFRTAQRLRALDWALAIGKLAISFEAEHGGGWPDNLVQCGVTPEHRLKYLRGLGFRVRERYEMNVGTLVVPEIHQCCRLYGGIVADLTDGWVGPEAAR